MSEGRGRQDDGNDRADIQLAQVEFGALTVGETIGHLYLAEDTNTDATDRLVARYAVAALATAGIPVTFQFDSANPGDALRVLDT